MNLYFWPARDCADRSFEKDGLAINEWSRGGLRFAAVFDSSGADLRQFRQMLEKRPG